MWPFTRKRTEAEKAADERLLVKLLDAEGTRQDRIANLELKRLELEYASLEQRAKIEREGAVAKEELRKARREYAAKRPRDNRGSFRATPDGRGCRVCANQSDPTLSAEEILFHNQGHVMHNGYSSSPLQ